MPPAKNMNNKTPANIAAKAIMALRKRLLLAQSPAALYDEGVFNERDLLFLRVGGLLLLLLGVEVVV